MDNVQRFMQDGGTVKVLKPEQHGPAYNNPKAIKKPPIIHGPPPSAKSCRRCDNYTRGAGSKSCLACKNYKLMDMDDPMRETVAIIPMVSELLEAFPSPPRPDNDLMAIIRQLPAVHAAMVSMHYYGALSVREIALVLDIPQANANRKLYRAVSQLRKIIHQRYPNLKSKKEATVSQLLSPI
jgi:hypothetical protein